MNRTRSRLLAACLAVAAAAFAVAGGTAGNRNGVAELDAIPGPGRVTYGENIAYQATFANTNSASGSVFTQVKVTLQPPVITGTSQKATPVKASCGSFDDNDVLTCEFGQLRPGQQHKLTVVWKTPALSSAGCTDCLEASGAWTIKEGKLTNPSAETFFLSELASLIGPGGVGAVNGNHNAGGYELEGCVDEDETSLETNQAIDPITNPVTTSFCVPASFVANGAADGVTATITEPSGGANFARQTEVCVSKPGTQCGADNYEAQDFSPDAITVEITVSDEALDDVIKEVSHNGVPLELCEDDPGNANGCIIEIRKPKGNQDIPAWVILAKSPTNGPYGW
jgi:hypothetical protein